VPTGYIYVIGELGTEPEFMKIRLISENKIVPLVEDDTL
jgi:hypothetical protein